MINSYKNYHELQENDKSLALELLNDKGKGEWQKQEIYFHDNIECFAEYELIDGWYIDLNLERDFNGAPNPLDFINLEELGNALARHWDDTCNFQSINGNVLQTGYGW